MTFNLSSFQFPQGERELDWISNCKGSETQGIFFKDCPSNPDASSSCPLKILSI